jgi:hypothetical protein
MFWLIPMRQTVESIIKYCISRIRIYSTSETTLAHESGVLYDKKIESQKSCDTVPFKLFQFSNADINSYCAKNLQFVFLVLQKLLKSMYSPPPQKKKIIINWFSPRRIPGQTQAMWSDRFWTRPVLILTNLTTGKVIRGRGEFSLQTIDIGHNIL